MTSWVWELVVFLLVPRSTRKPFNGGLRSKNDCFRRLKLRLTPQDRQLRGDAVLARLSMSAPKGTITNVSRTSRHLQTPGF